MIFLNTEDGFIFERCEHYKATENIASVFCQHSSTCTECKLRNFIRCNFEQGFSVIAVQKVTLKGGTFLLLGKEE